MKARHFLLPLLLLAAGPSARADTETVGGIEWFYSVSAGCASVTGANTSSGSLNMPNVLGGFPVTSIGGFAFKYCSGLTSVTIPDSVTSIGSYAFEECSRLWSVTIGDGVTSIGDYVFWDCSRLRSLSLPGHFRGKTSYMGIPSGCTVTFRD